jgi:adenylosuccinate synthase
MPCRVVLGGQWGDEGKGKVVDYLSARADVVVRCQGGANAGHTLVDGDRSFAVHLIPSGVLHPGCEILLGSGMVIDPIALLEEITALESTGVSVRDRLRVSTAAHLVLPIHRLQDGVEEQQRNGDGQGIGTTGRGIGPAYADKAARSGLQMSLFARPQAEARERLRQFLERKKQILHALSPSVEVDIGSMVESVLACREALQPLLDDTTHRLHRFLDQGRNVLLEGAQGALLDLDHGSYPYVTSSSCTTSGALTGAGVSPRDVDEVIGIVKAYATRVGNGPFPTEIDDAEGEQLRDRGREFGATTGRPRRCGWFDAVAVRHVARLCGFTSLTLTKLDVLDTFERIRVATAYEINGERVEFFPSDTHVLQECRPSYTALPGWRASTRDCRTLEDLPTAARRYLDALQEFVGVPIRMLSVGPDRDSTLEFSLS